MIISVLREKHFSSLASSFQTINKIFSAALKHIYADVNFFFLYKSVLPVLVSHKTGVRL